MARLKAFDQDDVLDRAMRLFWQQGYEATSIRDMLAHVGISSSSLYETYGDKHALYLAALAHFRQIEYDLIQTQLTKSSSAKEVIRHWYTQLIDDLLADPYHRGSFTVNAAIEMGTRDPEVAAELQAHFDEVTASLAAFLRAGQQRGDVRPGLDPVALAQFFLSTLFGIAVQVKIYPSRPLLENIATAALGILD